MTAAVVPLWAGFPVPTGVRLNPQPQLWTPPRHALKCQATSKDYERKLSPQFIVSDKILDTVSDKAESDGASVLLDMPYEILLTIYDSLGHAPSQIALALTCKRMAMVARDVHLSLSATSARYAGFLPKRVFDVPDLMAQLNPWMPATLRLCNHCLTNRPLREDYWNTIVGCEISNFWIQKTGWTFHDASWHKQVHDICPACHVSCTLSDYVDCDGCRTLGRLGDIDWSRVTESSPRRIGPDSQSGGSVT
ncbi:hypothetical protein A1O3_08916 [Capronia epimyces CBS 606.96]|uniref:F-box domain-containing protein n=1 Tax=Capronia epimyces CBS 606.96 TaxID=1182542 RepID=W9YAM4_9EURO|nr:uncharacterized protein A1O3_08916 [Capronia epimyces CBS 606.96]EXJ79414.1 hypothetical protein A1O3_08916 [Capronia epimyces CBS 606.96]